MQQKQQRQQRGFIEIGAVFGLIVFAIISARLTNEYIAESRELSADNAGVMAAQVKHAIRAAVAEQGLSIPVGTFSGTGWLKDSGSCAGATGSGAYLPCSFPDSLPFGLSYDTSVAVTGTDIMVSTSLGAPSSNGETLPYLGGSIASAINGSSNDFVTPVTQTYHVATHDETTGVVSFDISNSVENLEFLKKDGSVVAEGDFDWGGNNIANVGQIDAIGSVNAANVNAAGTVSSASASISGTSTAARHTSTTDARAPIFYDSNNTGYYIDGASRSRLNTLDISSMRDRNNTAYTWDASGTSRMNYVLANVLRGYSSFSFGSSCTSYGAGAYARSGNSPAFCNGSTWQPVGYSPATYSYNGRVSNNRNYTMQTGSSGVLMINLKAHGKAVWGWDHLGGTEETFTRLYVNGSMVKQVMMGNYEWANRKSGYGTSISYTYRGSANQNVSVRGYVYGRPVENLQIDLNGTGL